MRRVIERLPVRRTGNPQIDDWQDEQTHSLFDGRARYKVQQQSDEQKPKITLPKGYEPAFLR